MKVRPCALKVGICADDAVQAAERTPWIEALGDDSPPTREMRLGFDIGALRLETVVLILENGDELIIHAMPARKKYLDLLPSLRQPARTRRSHPLGPQLA